MQEFQAYVKKQICFVPYFQKPKVLDIQLCYHSKGNNTVEVTHTFLLWKRFPFLNKKYHSYYNQYSMHPCMQYSMRWFGSKTNHHYMSKSLMLNKSSELQNKLVKQDLYVKNLEKKSKMITEWRWIASQSIINHASSQPEHHRQLSWE